MASSYPTGFDQLSNPAPTDKLNTPGVFHDLQHTNANDAIEAVQAALGLRPAGTASSVAARFTADEAAIVATRAVADDALATAQEALDAVDQVDQPGGGTGTPLLVTVTDPAQIADVPDGSLVALWVYPTA